MIGRVSKHSSDPVGLVSDLYRPARACADSGAYLVAGWQNPAGLEPPLREDGERDFRDLDRLLRQPLALLGDQAPTKPAWHCEVRAAPDDPELANSAWMRIAGEVMNRTGLSSYGEESQGVPWVAVYHGGSHLHIVATLARQDGCPTPLYNEYYRIGDVLRDMEAEFGLRRVSWAGPAVAQPDVLADDTPRLAKASFPATPTAGTPTDFARPATPATVTPPAAPLAAESFPRDLPQGMRLGNSAATSAGRSAHSAARRQPEQIPQAAKGRGRP
jgi:hypothetical protein